MAKKKVAKAPKAKATSGKPKPSVAIPTDPIEFKKAALVVYLNRAAAILEFFADLDEEEDFEEEEREFAQGIDQEFQSVMSQVEDHWFPDGVEIDFLEAVWQEIKAKK